MLLRERGMGKEAEPAEAIIHRHEDDALPREPGAVVEAGRAGAVEEAAAVNPHHHRQPGASWSVGVHTLSVRQSSLNSPGAGVKGTRVCMQEWPKAVALRVPCHGVAGCGGRQRSAPTGGAA